MRKNVFSIQLSHFRRFEKTEKIIFPPGVTILSGGNGSGKSTVIESFSYGLFGPGTKKGQRANEIRTDNTNHGDICVELECVIDNQQIKISRKGSRASLWIDGILQVQGIANSQRQVTRRVSELLGNLTREQFENTYVALQGDTAGLVDAKPEERRRTIEKLLQLEVLTQAIIIQQSYRDSTKHSVRQQGDRLDTQLQIGPESRELLATSQRAAKLENQIEHSQKYVSAAKTIIDAKSLQLEAFQKDVITKKNTMLLLQQKRSEYRDNIAQLDALYKKHEGQQTCYQSLANNLERHQWSLESLQAEQASLLQKIDEAQGYQNEAEQYGHLQADLKWCEQRLVYLPLLNERYTFLTQIHNSIEQLNNKIMAINAIEDAIDAAQKQEEKAKKDLDLLRNNDPTEVDGPVWQSQASKLKVEQEQNSQALDLLQNNREDAYCPTCHQQLTEHTAEQRVQHLNNWFEKEYPQQAKKLKEQKNVLVEKKQQWKKEQQNLAEDLSTIQSKLQTLQKKAGQKAALEEQRITAQTQKQQKQREWDNLNEPIPDPMEKDRVDKKKDEIDKSLIQLQPKANLYARLPELKNQHEEKQQSIISMGRQIEELETQLSSLAFNPDQMLKIQEQLEAGRQQEQIAQNDLDRATDTLNSATTSEQNCQNDLAQSQREYVRFEEALKEYLDAEKLFLSISAFKKHFFEANTKHVTQRTAELLREAITDQSILGIQFQQNELQYLDGSNMPRAIRRLSGGEKALVGLCLRLALAEQAQTISKIGKVKFLILDEVLASLDEERSEAVQRIFQNILQRGIFEQIIMVTHLDSVKQSWQAYGLVVQKEHNSTTSTIRIVEPYHTYSEASEEVEG